MVKDSIRNTLQNMNPELGLNFRSFLLDCTLKFDKQLWNNEEAKGKIFKNSEFLTEGKYRYLLALFFTSKDHNKTDQDRWLASEKFKREIELLINL